MGLILYQERYTQTIQDTGEEGKRERRRKGERKEMKTIYELLQQEKEI